jgi:hypothetical protein
MRESESTKELTAALAKAQAKIPAANKSHKSQIGAREYAYADLSDLKASYQEHLSANGLTISSAMAITDGHMTVTTKLSHVSGEWRASDYPVAAYPTPQQQGSAITYAKRYNVSALLDLVGEDDDDGQAAQNGAVKAQTKKPEPKADAATAKYLEERANDPETLNKPLGLSVGEVEMVHSLAKRAGLKSSSELAPILLEICGVAKASAIPKREFQNVLDHLEQMASRIPA